MIIDITNEVLTALKTALTGVTVLTAYPSTKPSFPCVIIEELGNNANIDTKDSSGFKYCDCGINIDIFTESKNKMTQAKTIRNSIDTIMSGTYGMTREFAGVTPNLADSEVYRYTMRYTYTINSNKTIFRG